MNPTEFAAKRREVLADSDERLAPAVVAGLARYLSGEDQWYSEIIDAAAQIWLENFEAESPGANYTMALARFRESVKDSMEKTGQPEGEVTRAQVDRITRWLSTYSVNAGTMDATFRRGIRYKVWATMEDDDVREIHRDLAGTVVPMGSTFNVNGARLPYPGAPVGPPEGWIECRCVAQPASREGEVMSANTYEMGPEVVTAAADLTNPDGTPYTGALIVLVPADSDPIAAASSEPAHLTTVWFGDMAEMVNRDTPEFPQIDLDTLIQEVQNYASDLTGPVVVPVSQVGTLGDDEAQVAFLEPTEALVALRDGLLAHEQIGSAHNAVEQFPEWTPHVTLGYPDRPANAEYDATEVTFDRLSLWLGGEHYDYPMGGTVSDTVTADASSSPIDDQSDLTEAPAEVVPEDEVDDDEELDPMIPIHGVLAPEGILSGDGRGFREGAVTSRALPLHYRYEFVGSHGGNQTSQAVTVGPLTEVWRHTDGMIRFRGFIDSSRPYADQAIADILMGIGFNSIDADAMEQDVSMYFDADGNMIDQPAPTAEDAGKVPETWYSAVRVAGLTQVPIQAFPETYTALGHDFEEDMTEEELIAAAAILEDCGCGDVIEPFATGGIIPAGQHVLVGEQGPEAVIPLGRVEAYESARRNAAHLSQVGTFAPGTKDGPGWITNPAGTKRIRDYWTRGAGAAKIRWGTPGDFNRCRAQLAKYVQNPEWLAGLCANMHYEVLKKWPGPGKGKGRHGLAASGDIRDSMTLVASAHTIYSSAAFAEPTETRAFPMRINRETREIVGYAAQWGSCHIGISGMCQEAPKSRTDYSYFRKGIVETDAGEQSVGLITFGIGHAGESMSAARATAHYDRTEAVKAYINIGENAYGIWYAGVLAPWVTDADIDAMLAIRRVSGDWRNWSGRRGDLEMVGLVCVNTEGFQLAASAALDGMVGGAQTVAIGIGAVPIDDEVLTASADGETHDQFVARLAVEVERQIAFRARQASIRQRAFNLRQSEVRRRASEGV